MFVGMDPAEIRRHMEFSMRVQLVRSAYHRAMGEVVLFQLTFEDEPEFVLTEDLGAGSVTVPMAGGEGRGGLLVRIVRSSHDYLLLLSVRLLVSCGGGCHQKPDALPQAPPHDLNYKRAPFSRRRAASRRAQQVGGTTQKTVPPAFRRWDRLRLTIRLDGASSHPPHRYVPCSHRQNHDQARDSASHH